MINKNYFRSRRPVPSLNNTNNPISQTKKVGQTNNYYPFLPPSTTSQNQTSIRPTSTMGNFLSTQNGQSPLINGDLGQNFPSLNVSIKL